MVLINRKRLFLDVARYNGRPAMRWGVWHRQGWIAHMGYWQRPMLIGQSPEYFFMVGPLVFGITDVERCDLPSRND